MRFSQIRLGRRWLIAALSLGLVTALGCRAQAPASPRDDFRKLILSDRQAAPLNPQLTAQSEVGTVRVERVKFTAETGFDAVALINRPKAEGKYPVVVVQHFLGGSKDHPLFGPLLMNLAQRGYLVAAIDGRYRGERQNGKSLETAMVEALRSGKGRPFLLDSAYDVLRLVDYLQTRPDVDGSRIGMTGFSEGGILTWMCAVADDRIRVAVPIIGVTCFGETLRTETGPETTERVRLFDAVLREYARDVGEKEANGRVLRLAWEKLVPGMLDRFDAPQLLPLIAPRPLLVLSHELDELFPLAGARRAVEATRARYRELGAEDKLDFRVAPGLKHSGFSLVEINSMMQWFDRWLKPPAN